jgi:hypothetical protein
MAWAVKSRGAKLVTTALLTAGAALLTLPLAFLFVGIPGFMLPTTGSDPDETPEFYFWIVVWIAIPFLTLAIWSTAVGLIWIRHRWYWIMTKLSLAAGVALPCLAYLCLRLSRL